VSDYLEDVVYESRHFESPRVAPPGRTSRRTSLGEGLARFGSQLRRPLGVFLVVCVLLIGLVMFLPPPGERAATPEEDLGTPRGGLLADLRGDDVLHRLETTQAALTREMAFLREAASRGGAPLPEEPETVWVLAAHGAQLEQLGAVVARLQADRMRLGDMAVGLKAGLEALSRRLTELEEALADQSAGERN